MNLTVSGRVTETRFLQSVKASLQIVFTESGTLTDVSFSDAAQSLPFTIHKSFSLRRFLSHRVSRKGQLLVGRFPSGKFTEERFVHPLKASRPNISTFSGIVTEVRLEQSLKA